MKSKLLPWHIARGVKAAFAPMLIAMVCWGNVFRVYNRNN